ncbi:MAG: BadF/BadG/BcrA/BcrD ATPase family protein [Candidatus Parvarchaeota archaeon]
MILAVDGGATKTIALVYDENRLELKGVGIAGPTNLTSVSKEELRGNLRKAVNQACEEASTSVKEIRKLLFGLAGIGDSPTLTSFGQEIIKESIARSDFVAMNDGRPAYMMSNLDDDGIVFAGGTGSVAFFKIGNTIERRGGWNWFAGDNGSASWMAKRALNLATFEYDGLLEKKLFVNSVEEYFEKEFKEALATIEANQDKRYVAGFAPYVTKLAKAGYGPAIEILDECADYVVKIIESIIPKFANPPRISLVGGTMLAGDIYIERIRRRIKYPLHIYYGYQVAVGGILILLNEIGIKSSYDLRDALLGELEDLLSNKDSLELRKYLFKEKV